MSPTQSQALEIVKKNRQSRWPSWLALAGTCSSALCAIHCFGFALIALSSPGLLQILPKVPWIEGTVLLVALVASVVSLMRVQAGPISWALLLFFSVTGIFGWFGASFAFLSGSLLGLALFQLILLWKLHNPQNKDIPPCCAEESKKHL